MKHVEMTTTHRELLQQFFHTPTSAWSRTINLILVIVIAASVLVTMLATDKQLSPQIFDILCIGEYIFVSLFLIEYLLRLYAAPNRLRYVLSIYGAIDLLAIVPVFALGMDGNSLALRIIRILSILRVLKVIRYWGDLMMLLIAMKESARLLALVCLAVLLLAIIGGNLIYYVEPENFHTAFDGMWWTLVTMSTVGYGDMVPHSMAGKVLAGIGMFLGIGIFAVITAVIGSKIHLLTEHRHTRCGRCSDVVPITSHFCMHCGMPLKTLTTSTAAAVNTRASG